MSTLKIPHTSAVGRQTVQFYKTNQKPGIRILSDPKTGGPDFERTPGRQTNRVPKAPKNSPRNFKERLENFKERLQLYPETAP